MMPARRSVDTRRRAVLLPVTLLMLVLIGLIAAGSSFYVHADLTATQSVSHRFKARQAAEAGIQKVMLNLRTDQANVDAWYHNPEEYHRILVWGQNAGEEELGLPEEYDDDDRSQRFRFSIVADDPTDDEMLVRYGITDESSKLNVNVATRDQLVALIGQFTTEEMNVDELADALIDWRDANSEVNPFGAETEYYARLDPPYAVKNRPLDTVEELLLIRGFTGALLYGEDYDRNGLMSPNEDDGDESFPPDNADSELNRGLISQVTVFSRSLNRTADNMQRTYIFGEPGAISASLAEVIDDPAKIEFISQAGAGDPRIKSPAELLKPRTVRNNNPNNPNSKGGNKNNQPETTTVPSPITLEDMPWVMDLLTTTTEGEFVGRININTASASILSSLGALTEEDIEAILTVREELTPEQKQSTGWLAAIIGADEFTAVAPLLCARGNRFRVESLGYGDHIGTVVRLEVILEMRGPVAQIVYNRDITMLGTAYPIRFAEGDSELVGFTR